MKNKKLKSFILLVLVACLLCPPCAFAETGDIFDVEVSADAAYNGYMFLLKENAEEDLALNSEDVSDVGGDIYLADSVEDIQSLYSEEDIAYIEPNYELTLYAPNDPYYSSQWNLRMVNAQTLWDSGRTASGATIAVIDSGLIANHQDMNYGRVKTGYNYLTKSTNTADSNGHGTFVTGVIAATTNNGIGISGMVSGAAIVPLKVFGGVTTDSSLAVTAIYEAVNKYGANVINMSFGMETQSQSLYNAVKYAASKDVIMVASAGNDGNSTIEYPAAYNEVIGVGSVDSSKVVSSFSQRNSSVFVTAPGESIISLGYASSNSYVQSSGTSFSAPGVAAVAALAKAHSADITISEFKNLLISGSDDLGASGYDTSYGYGLINLSKIVSLMELPFTDIYGHWAYDNIGYVYRNGFFNGTSGSRFSPDIAMSRAMLITVLGRMYESSGGVITNGNAGFTDTESGSWYSKYLAWAESNKIVEGYGNGHFGPSDSVTREQAAVILYRYANYCGLDTGGYTSSVFAGFKDFSGISDWAKDAMCWSVGKGLIRGMDNALNPKATSVRAQIAAMAERYDTTILKGMQAAA